MSTINVLANGPINFTAKDGFQKSLPISMISYVGNDFHINQAWLDSNGSGGKPFSENDITPLLSQLLAEGVLQIVSPPISKAMIITAVDPGVQGNTILISFSNFKKTNPVTFDVTVTETIIYNNVTPLTIATALGISKDEKAGLVFVSKIPDSLPKTNSPYQLAGDPGKVSIDTTTGNPFELTAKKGGADSSQIKVTISNLTATDFTLTASWSKSKSQITVTDLNNNPFSYIITIAPPIGVNNIGIPAEGVIKLVGGIDAQGPTPASAVVMTG